MLINESTIKLSLIANLIICASIILSNNFSVSEASVQRSEVEEKIRCINSESNQLQSSPNAVRELLRDLQAKNSLDNENKNEDKLPNGGEYTMEHYVSWEWTEVCCDGYESPDSLSGLRCKPRCDSGCRNGECRKPNTCDCKAGYVAATNNITGWSECLPYCANNCPNGRCTAPNVCDCDPGFIIADDRASCKASCASVGREGSQGCGKNASCIAPNVCRCDAGYKAISKTAIANSSTRPAQTTITATYTEQPELATEEPIFYNDAFFCEPTCSPSCSPDASCVAPDRCECDPGYSVQVASHHIKNESRHCFPVCEKKCVNSFCSYPMTCTCFEAYKTMKNDSFACEPICDQDCINAICTLPNHCECRNGYEKSSHLQHPEHICTPICSGGCFNGNCIGPDTCVCNEGYIFTYEESNNTKSLTCQPHCTPQCHNGSLCVAPDQCLLQLPLTSVEENCNDNGILSEVNGSCTCHYGWTGLKCEEPKFCGIFIAFNNESDAQFLSAERVYYPGKWYWNGPHCNKECKHSMSLFKAPENTSTDVVNCYHLELMEQTSGLVSYEVSLSEAFGGTHDTIFCFLAADSSCNVTRFHSMSIIFGSLSLLLVIGCGIILYRLRDRLRRITRRETPHRVADDLMEPLRVTETLDRTRADDS